MIVFACVTLIFLIVTVDGQSRQGRRVGKQLPPCHWKQIDDCIKPTFYFSHRPNTTGLALNRREHALLCRTIKNVTSCVEDFFGRCGTQFSQEMFVLINEVYTNNVKPFCRNGDQKNNYLEHARCMNKVKISPTFKKKCVSKFQATLESMSDREDYADRVGVGCCGFKVFSDCAQGMIGEQCPPPDASGRAFLDYMNAITGGVPEYVCRAKKYDADSKYCQKVLPTVRRRPKGRNSDNVFSKYFSLFYPNIGF